MKAFYFTLILGMFACAGVRAQVTIGMDVPPVTGMILEVKNRQPTLQIPKLSADRGLKLPRVALTDVDNLYPMFLPSYNKTQEDKRHKGLMVYNTNTVASTFTPGIYVWKEVSTGVFKWQRLGS